MRDEGDEQPTPYRVGFEALRCQRHRIMSQAEITKEMPNLYPRRRGGKKRWLSLSREHRASKVGGFHFRCLKDVSIMGVRHHWRVECYAGRFTDGGTSTVCHGRRSTFIISPSVRVGTEKHRHNFGERKVDVEGRVEHNPRYQF